MDNPQVPTLAVRIRILIANTDQTDQEIADRLDIDLLTVQVVRETITRDDKLA